MFSPQPIANQLGALVTTLLLIVTILAVAMWEDVDGRPSALNPPHEYTIDSITAHRLLAGLSD